MRFPQGFAQFGKGMPMRTFVAACLIFVLLPSLATLHAQSSHPGQAPLDVLSRVTKVKGLRLVATQPPTDGSCRTYIGVPCYSLLIPGEVARESGMMSPANPI